VEHEIDILYIMPHAMPVEMTVPNNYEVFKGLLNDGYMESVTISQLGCVLLIDEDGKLKNLPINRAATLMFHPYLLPLDYIVGPCIVTGMVDRGGDFTSFDSERTLALVDKDIKEAVNGDF
jgi:Domain of unknown function (DUF3846)